MSMVSQHFLNRATLTRICNAGLLFIVIICFLPPHANGQTFDSSGIASSVTNGYQYWATRLARAKLRRACSELRLAEIRDKIALIGRRSTDAETKSVASFEDSAKSELNFVQRNMFPDVLSARTLELYADHIDYISQKYADSYLSEESVFIARQNVEYEKCKNN